MLRQDDLKSWQDRNFDNTELLELSREELIKKINVLQMALGMAEEVGEVCHHVLKGTQHIRGGIDGIDTEQIADGFADVTIFGTQLCSALDINAEVALHNTISSVLERDWKKNPEGK